MVAIRVPYTLPLFKQLFRYVSGSLHKGFRPLWFLQDHERRSRLRKCTADDSFLSPKLLPMHRTLRLYILYHEYLWSRSIHTGTLR